MDNGISFYCPYELKDFSLSKMQARNFVTIATSLIIIYNITSDHLESTEAPESKDQRMLLLLGERRLLLNMEGTLMYTCILYIPAECIACFAARYEALRFPLEA